MRCECRYERISAHDGAVQLVVLSICTSSQWRARVRVKQTKTNKQALAKMSSKTSPVCPGLTNDRLKLMKCCPLLFMEAETDTDVTQWRDRHSKIVFRVPRLCRLSRGVSQSLGAYNQTKIVTEFRTFIDCLVDLAKSLGVYDQNNIGFRVPCLYRLSRRLGKVTCACDQNKIGFRVPCLRLPCELVKITIACDQTQTAPLRSPPPGLLPRRQ